MKTFTKIATAALALFTAVPASADIDSMQNTFLANGQHLRETGGPFSQHRGCYPLKQTTNMSYNKHVRVPDSGRAVLVYSENGIHCYGRDGWFAVSFTDGSVVAVPGGLEIHTARGVYFVESGARSAVKR